MIISFMILDGNATFSKRLKELIEQKLAEQIGIEAQVVTATSFGEAMDKKASIDIHLVDLDLQGKGNGFDYIKEISKSYPDDEPVIPVIVISSHNEEFYKMMSLNELKVISYIEKEKPYNEEQILKDLKRAVKCFKKFDDKTVTFSRPGYKRVYKERDIWCIKRLPLGQKKIMVSIYDESSKGLIEEEFSIKTSLTEVPNMFSSPDKMIRCHQSWLVNPRVIIGEAGRDLVLASGLKIPMGGEYRNNVEAHYMASK